jgi:uncharacterized protein HemX
MRMNLLHKGSIVNNCEATIRKQNMILSLAALLVVAGLFYQGMYFLQQNMQTVSWEK